MTRPAISEVKVATVGVTDLEASVAFYSGCFDYVEHGRGPISPEETAQLWGGATDLVGEAVVLGPAGGTTGLVRLVHYPESKPLYWGDYSRLQDLGHYALNIRVPEINAAMAAVAAHGGKTRSGPTHWTVTPDLSAWDSLSWDPDGILVDVFQLEPGPANPLADYDGRPTGLQTVCLHSANANASARFYAALGLRPLYDKLLERMEDFFHLPDGVGLHNINMMHPDRNDSGRVEIAQYVGFEGDDQRHLAVAGTAGILSLAFETTDLDATTVLLKAIGTETAGDEIEVDQVGFGRVRVRAWFGPDGERVEFFQRL
ncbi:VOC family protein [Nocardioides yefusunii]|uniref:VOC family protein n=1 Tax=Nocardioides yefusunii TaxID=2500546 RepID=A0ABW1QWU7_9ACTN|nr:hypothetical protein [Nocardioides yefusunii]